MRCAYRETVIDAVILGGGAGGLTLACHLGAAGWEGDALLVDSGAHPVDGRAWAWWSEGDLLLDAHATTALGAAHVAGDSWHRRLELAPFAYRAITGAALTDAVDALAGPRLTRLPATALAVEPGPGGARVTVREPGGTARTLVARHVFDSVGLGNPWPGPRHAPHLDFSGVRIEAEAPLFDSDAVTLMDFRTPQDGVLAFIYVLPSSSRTALVQRVAFVLPGDDTRGEASPLGGHGAALDAYLDRISPGVRVRVVGGESGLIPLDAHAPRPGASGIVPLGAQAGMVRASTGYGFARMQRHAAGIAAALVADRDPAVVARPRRWERALDRALLRLIREDQAAAREVLAALFVRHPAPRVLRFLDGEASLLEQLRVCASLPEFALARARRSS